MISPLFWLPDVPRIYFEEGRCLTDSVPTREGIVEMDRCAKGTVIIVFLSVLASAQHELSRRSSRSHALPCSSSRTDPV